MVNYQYFRSKNALFFSDATTQPVTLNRNGFGGALSGPKRSIFCHTSQVFLTVALLRPAKTRFVWQKMATFFSQTRPPNPLL